MSAATKSDSSGSGRVADKHAFAEAFARSAPIVVDAPELGDGIEVRFKPQFTVDDILSVTAVPGWNREPLVLAMALARVALVGEDGQPLVPDGEAEWFQRGANGVLLARLARRAGLVDRFLLAFRSRPDHEDGDGEPLDAESLRRTVAELAVVMRLSPDSVRGWPARDLADTLDALKRRQE